MILTEQEIKEAVGFTTDQMTAYRRIESAVLEKLKAQEPVMYIHESGLLTGEDKDYNAGVRTGLYRHPDPRVAELEAVLRECRDVIDEAKTYCEGPQWSPSMAHDCGAAIDKIDEVLNG